MGRLARTLSANPAAADSRRRHPFPPAFTVAHGGRLDRKLDSAMSKLGLRRARTGIALRLTLRGRESGDAETFQSATGPGSLDGARLA